MTGSRRDTALLIVVLVLAALVRLIGIDWDQGHAFHPDERAIALAIERLSLHPVQLNPGFFAYGSLPIYAFAVAAGVLARIVPGWRDFSSVIIAGRVISAAAGVATVWVVFALGRRRYDSRVGLFAAFLMAVCVLHVQNSHFMTTDVLLTMFVVAAVSALVDVADGGDVGDSVRAGVLIGLAIATKATAALLAVPVAAAFVWRCSHDRDRRRTVAAAVSVTGVAVVAFLLAEPYTVLDFSTFWRQLAEQGRMVRHAGTLPYTVQYVGVTKYLYDVRELVLWGMGPLLGVAAICAAVSRLRRLASDARTVDVILAAWIVPYFLVFGWLDVKFVRYLLPIYPPLILWTAAWLCERAASSRVGRACRAMVGLGTFLATMAFLAIYAAPHTAVAASGWAYSHIAEGSTVLTEHWDEGFPLPLTLGQPSQFRVVELPYYEPDTPEKVHGLTVELAGGDFLVLPTRRLYGAITGAPHRYPLTTRYFEELFAGDLGYRCVYTRRSRPNLWGLEFPDELADESFTVYDHPKVLIFENVGHLPADRLGDLILRGRPSRALSRSEMLLFGDDAQGRGPARAPTPLGRESWLALFWVAFVVEVAGASAYVLMRRLLPDPGGYAVAKVIGLVAIVYPIWLVASLGIAHFARPALTAMFIIFAATALAWIHRDPTHREPPRDAAVTEVLFWSVFGLFLAVRACNPAVYWGEKPMDFAFLNVLTRTTALPPPEPWFAGSDLHYSYFGHYIVAALGKLCAVHPAVMFNVGVALFGGLTACGAYAAGCAIARSQKVGLTAAVLTVGIGNLSGPIEFLRHRTIDFDYFWATSRVIKDTINEYPLWSFLFADLHAHVLVMPLSLTFLTLSIWLARRSGRARFDPRHLLLVGWIFGAVIATNAWSAPTHVAVLFVLLACVYASDAPSGVRPAIDRFARAVALIGVVIGAAVALYLPFFWRYTTPNLGWGIERDAAVRFDDYALIFGLYLFVAIPFLFYCWRDLSGRAVDARRFARTRLAVAAALVVTFVGSMASARISLSRMLPQTAGLLLVQMASAKVGLTLLSLLALWVTTRRHLDEWKRLTAAMLALSFAITAGCDFIHVWDRMNTIFKFYLDAWFLFAVATAVAIGDVWRRSQAPLARVWRPMFISLTGVAAFTAITGVYAAPSLVRVPTPRPTLDGSAYLSALNPDEDAAIEWLNDSVEGLPVLAEATGPPYQQFSRISMHTGLPTVLGWEYHVFQRAQTRESIDERRAALEELYQSSSPDRVAEIVARYHIALVYVGELERKTYQGANLANFRAWNQLFTPAFETSGVTIFRAGADLPRHARPSKAMPAALDARAERDPSNAPGPLREPRGVAVDSRGSVYVADFGNDRVQQYEPDLRPVRAWTVAGGAPRRFNQPCAVTVGDGGELYVADTWNHRIAVLGPDGSPHATWTARLFGPRGVAAAPSGGIYVADTGNHRVIRFGRSGVQEGGWGSLGAAPGQFREPMGIAVDAAGRILVADNGNGRVQAFDSDGRFLFAFPVEGWRTEAFSEPQIAVSPDQEIWVTVPLGGAIRAYSERGALLREIREAKPGRPFVRPMGIAYRAAARDLVVTDAAGTLTSIALELPDVTAKGSPGTKNRR